MKVRLHTLMAGPDGVSQPGTVLDVPQAEAVRLAATGAASLMEPPQVEKREQAAVTAPEVRDAEAGTNKRTRRRYSKRK